MFVNFRWQSASNFIPGVQGDETPLDEVLGSEFDLNI